MINSFLDLFKAKHILFVLVIFFLSCQPSSKIENEKDKIVIVPLGDVRVQASFGSNYRYELWKIFEIWDHNVDFAGPYKDGSRYSAANNSFDGDHAGIGATSELMNIQFGRILNAVPEPDIILIGHGINEIMSNFSTPDEIIHQIFLMVDKFRQANSDVVILIEKIAPAKSSEMTTYDIERLNEYNSLIEVYAQQKQSATSPIHVVDMTLYWDDSLLKQGVYYNDIGAQVVAQRYYEVLAQYLD